jgi:hypothetical protein
MDMHLESVSAVTFLPAHHGGGFREATSSSSTSSAVHTDSGIFDSVLITNSALFDRWLTLGRRYLSLAALNFGYDVGM